VKINIEYDLKKTVKINKCSEGNHQNKIKEKWIKRCEEIEKSKAL
jgi:hypothetical protein